MLSLAQQLHNKIALLLDKPISPKSTQQILTLVTNQSSDKQKLLTLFLSKFRGDLIIYLLKQYPPLMNKLSDQIHTSLMKNLMKYETGKIKQIYGLILKFLYTNSQLAVGGVQGRQDTVANELVYKYGYQEFLKQGLKVTNLEKKDRIFQIIHCNVDQIWYELGQKALIRKIIATFVQIFRKYPITVPNYVSLLTAIIKIIKISKQKALSSEQKKSDQPEKQVQFAQNSLIPIPPPALHLKSLPDIPFNFISPIFDQLKTILKSTQDRPLHQLHKSCLIALTELMRYEKGRQSIQSGSQGVASLHDLQKIVQVYLFRKSTRDQARLVSTQIKKIQMQFQQENKLKMQKDFLRAVQQEQSANNNQGQNSSQSKPILIENVIDKTNQYIAKYGLANLPPSVVKNDGKNDKNFSQIFQNSPSGIISNISVTKDNLMGKNLFQKSSNKDFLRKGLGMGGGKAVLDIDDNHNKRGVSNESHHYSNKYDQVQSVIGKYSKQNANYRSNSSVPKKVLHTPLKKDKIDMLLDSCLSKTQNEWQYQSNNNNSYKKSKPLIKIMNKTSNFKYSPPLKSSSLAQQHSTPSHLQQRSQPKLNHQSQIQFQYDPVMDSASRYLQEQLMQNECFSSPSHQKDAQQYQFLKHSQQMMTDQVNELIDLAYSYKFSA